MTFSANSVAADKVEALREYRWKNRILLLNSQGSSDWRKQRTIFQRNLKENSERQLILILVDREKAQLWKTHDFADGQFQMLLIGKDGSIKKRYNQIKPMPEIYQVIDAMPMRQQEMKENQ